MQSFIEGAQHFGPDTIPTLGSRAVDALERYAPDGEILARAMMFGERARAIAADVHARIARKLKTEPIEEPCGVVSKQVLSTMPGIYETGPGAAAADGLRESRGDARRHVLAKSRGLPVLSTTRGAGKTNALRENGADDVVIDTGQVADEVRRRVPGGVDAALELIGPVTLLDSLRAVRPRGIVCHTGLLGNVWVMDRFEPLEDIPSTVRLTTYHSGTTSAERSTAALQEIADGVVAEWFRPNVERVFRFEEIVAAHRFMEENRGTGKLVVVLDT